MAKDGKTILIVDDNETDAKFLQRNLEKSGIQIPTTIIPSGKLAIEHLQNHLGKEGSSPDQNGLPKVIFLDLKLADISGLQVLQWITAQPSLRRVLVIIHSGIATPKDIDALYAAGANSFLRKANDTQELQSLVEYFKGHFS